MVADFAYRVVRALGLLSPERLWRLEGLGEPVIPKLDPVLAPSHPSSADPLDTFDWAHLLGLVPASERRAARSQIDRSFERMIVIGPPASDLEEIAAERRRGADDFIHLTLCEPVVWSDNGFVFVRKRSAQVTTVLFAWTDGEGRQRELSSDLVDHLDEHGIRPWARDRW